MSGDKARYIGKVFHGINIEGKRIVLQFCKKLSIELQYDAVAVWPICGA